MDEIFIDDIENETKLIDTKSTIDEDDKRDSLCEACNNTGKIYTSM